MKGKTIVATGATSGIGEAAVLALAGQGARIVIVARDEARGRATMQKIEAKAPGLGHRLHLADLSSIAETRQVGAGIAASEPRIDVLINNAGALFSNRRVTPEGVELTFALNHMSYFVLTEALRERLIASAPARIVSTSSTAGSSPPRADFSKIRSPIFRRDRSSSPASLTRSRTVPSAALASVSRPNPPRFSLRPLVPVTSIRIS